MMVKMNCSQGLKIDVNKVSLSREAFLSLAKLKLLHVGIKYK